MTSQYFYYFPVNLIFEAIFMKYAQISLLLSHGLIFITGYRHPMFIFSFSIGGLLELFPVLLLTLF